MRRANRSNTIADHFFELLLDILTDNKYHIIETSLNRIMDRVQKANKVGFFSFDTTEFPLLQN